MYQGFEFIHISYLEFRSVWFYMT